MNGVYELFFMTMHVLRTFFKDALKKNNWHSRWDFKVHFQFFIAGLTNNKVLQDPTF